MLRRALALLLFGCGAAPEPYVVLDPCDDADPLTIQVGTGDEDFTTITSDTVLDFFPGPQGCCHVWGGLLANGMVVGQDARDVYFQTRIDFALIDADNGDSLGGIFQIHPTVNAVTEGGWDVAGVTVFVDDVDTATGRPFEMMVTVEDACGRTASDAATGMLGVLE